MRYKFFYYLCKKCDREFDILKTYSEKSRQESCIYCGNPLWVEDLIEKAAEKYRAKVEKQISA